MKWMMSLAVLGLALAVAGCSDDRPHDYGQDRPAVDQIMPGDGGLQGKDLLAATDDATADLLALPALNTSRTQWTIVATPIENQTTDALTQYNVFVDRLKTQLFKQGQGRVTLIESRDRYKAMQGHELEGGTQQGGPGIQPDYFLNGKIQELPNRATSTYRIEFDLTSATTREILWTHDYVVKVAR